MSHVVTKDPFGFVGSHVVRKGARKQGEEHGWLTRYDDALDCYTLFVPGGGEPRLLPRGEVMKFLSAPNIELHDDDQDAFPPPVRDESTSRYLGVSLRRPTNGEMGADEDLRGHVTCFLPFADRYCVEYEDGTTEELSEAAVIDGMIALVKSPFMSSPRRKTRSSVRRTRASMESSEEKDTSPRTRRKRQRVETTVAAAESVEADERKEEDADVVEAEAPAPADIEEPPAPNILEVMNNIAGGARPNSLEQASAPIEEPMAIDSQEIAQPEPTEGTQESAENALDGANKDPTGDTLAGDVVIAPVQTPKKDVPFYIIEKKPHEATEPLPKRALAFELLRASLLNLLDRREASSVKIALQYDILRNTDVRDRDAVIRFVEADGLAVLNHLLNTFAVDVLADNDDDESTPQSDTTAIEKAQERIRRDDELLFVLKIVAMLPTPERHQVISSNIGKSVNYLTRTRGPPGRETELPKCIIALAKWIKASWIKNIPPVKKSSLKSQPEAPQSAPRAQQQARRGGHSGTTGRPSRQLNRRQPSPSERQPSRTPPVETEVPIDNTPIPRITRPRAAPAQQPVPTAISTPTPGPPQAPRRVTGGLKPDWMRQKENLSRSRFCIDDNTNVDTRLYRDSRARPITNVPVMPSQPQAPARDQNPDQSEHAGGPDGVFGRSQRLRFGKQWSRQEFFAHEPPGLLAQPPGSSYSMPSYGRSQYPPTHESYEVYVPPVRTSRRTPQRPILRRVSKYNDQPAIEGSGN